MVLALAGLLLIGCAEGGRVTPDAMQLTQIAEQLPEGPTKEAVQATAVARYVAAEDARLKAEAARLAEQNAASERQAAEAERERQVIAMTAEAQAVIDARESEALATRQAVNTQATAQAVAIEATRQAINLEAEATARAVSVSATATAQARDERATATAQTRDAEATATASAATATMTWAMEAVQLTAQSGAAIAAQATARAVQREVEIDEATQTLTTFAGWMLLLLGIVALVGVVWYLLPVVKARLQVIRRRQGEVEPLVVSLERIIMPSRLFSPLLNVEHESAPMLAPVNYQDRASARAQLVDVVGAARGDGRRVIRRSEPPPGGQGDQWKAQQSAPQWPTRVPLTGILDGPPSVRDLALGVTVREDGRSEIVKADMGLLVHVAVGGSSGWGKSVFLRALAFQLAQSVEPVDVALVDLEGATFAPFSQCGRLLYPVADNEQDALAIFQELTAEMDRRKALFARFPGVDSLRTYNARADEPLAPVVALVDEATALLADKSVENAIRTLVLRARKYGLWCVLGGQDWKATSLDTAIRNQLATRVQFRAMSASQSRVLLQRSGAERLDVAGRALAIIPGRQMVELQAPVIGYQDIRQAVSNGGPRCTMPTVEYNASGDDQAARIKELSGQGLSKRQIALEIFGYAGGAAYTAVTEALQSCTTTTRTPVQVGSTA